MISDGKELLECLCDDSVVPLLFAYLHNEGNRDLQNGAGLVINCLAQYSANNANSFISGYPEGSEYYLIMLQQYEGTAFM